MVTLISTPAQLQAMSNNLKESYELANDIDMTGFDWTPIGYYDGVTFKSGFEGNLDGKGFKVKNLTISKSKGMYLGLFGQAFYGTIQNVGLENVNINGSNCRLVGSLVAYSYLGTYKNCYVKDGSTTGQDATGGLFGSTIEATIDNCFSDVDVNINSSLYGGGFIGNADTQTVISNSYSKGKVTYLTTSPWNNYSGFVGYVRDGADTPTFSNCYWDTKTSLQPNVAKIGNPQTTNVTGLTGKTTAQMKTQSTYVGWDFLNTWHINNDYPTLKAFGVPVSLQDVTVNLSSHLNIVSSVLERSKRKVSISLSHVGNVTSEATRSLQVMKNVTSHIDEIVSNVVTLQNANVKEYQVSSYIEGIGSNASRVIRTTRTVTTDIQPIQIITDIEIPVDVEKPVFASVYIVENVTSLQARNNYSIASIKFNRTEMTVI